MHPTMHLYEPSAVASWVDKVVLGKGTPTVASRREVAPHAGFSKGQQVALAVFHLSWYQGERQVECRIHLQLQGKALQGLSVAQKKVKESSAKSFGKQVLSTSHCRGEAAQTVQGLRRRGANPAGSPGTGAAHSAGSPGTSAVDSVGNPD
eukprot:100580-Amphidinium_carterae.1